jgi:hypothetical protein
VINARLDCNVVNPLIRDGLQPTSPWQTVADCDAHPSRCGDDDSEQEWLNARIENMQCSRQWRIALTRQDCCSRSGCQDCGRRCPPSGDGSRIHSTATNCAVALPNVHDLQSGVEINEIEICAVDCAHRSNPISGSSPVRSVGLTGPVNRRAILTPTPGR